MLDLEFALALGGGQFRQRLRQAFLQAVEADDGLFVSAGGFAAGEVGGDDKPDLFAHMVEGQHLVEEEQASVGYAEFIFGQIRQALDLTDGVISEEADGAGGEGRQALEAGGLMSAQGAAQHGEDVAIRLDNFLAFGDGDLAAARDDALEGRKADEGVTSDLFAVLDRFEHEAFALRPSGAQKGRDRRFEVRRENAADGDKRVLLGEHEKFFAAGLDGICGSFHTLSVIVRRTVFRVWRDLYERKAQKNKEEGLKRQGCDAGVKGASLAGRRAIRGSC